LIDLDGDVDVDIDALCTELMQRDAVPEVALRAGSRLVPRLARSRALSQPTTTTISAEKTYLVTGGLGGLGLIVASRLANLGARHVALMGRRVSGRGEQEEIRDMRSRGLAVHLVSGDVTERESLARALETLKRSAPPIGGVIHAAAVLDDATLLTLSPGRLEKVLAPKVLGPALLAELLPDVELFVAFSSIAGLLGSAGQAAYAAGNAYLDAWAHHRAHSHSHALSLDWGAWAKVGMAAQSAVRASHLARRGLGFLEPDQAGDLFEQLLSSTHRQLVPVAIDLEKLRAGGALVSALPILEDLVDVHTECTAGTVARFRSATAQEQLSILDEYLRSAVGRVMGGGSEVPSTTPLKELGLDSLMLLNLRNIVSRELSVEISGSTLLSLPTIAQIASHLSQVLSKQADTPSDRVEVRASVAEEVVRTPATRDVIRLLRGEQQGTPCAAHHIGVAARLRVRTDVGALEAILDRMSKRHAALRTTIVEDGASGFSLEVRPAATRALLSSFRLLAEGDTSEAIARRLEELLEPPFVLGEAPLWRFELVDTSSGEQFLLFGAHHAVSDANSHIVVMAEIDRELGGAELSSALSNRDFDSLLRSQSGGSTGTSVDWREEFAGCERLELTLASTRPAQPTFRTRSVFLPVPDGLLEKVTTEANRLAATPAAFCLSMLTVLLARVTTKSAFAVAVPVDTRVHDDVPDAIGFFGVPVPVAARACPDEAIVDVVRRTDQKLTRVLEKGAAFSNALAALVQEGLHREGAPLVEVYFNYLRPQTARFENLEIVEAGTGYGDVDLMVSVAPDLGQLRMDFHRDILDEARCTELGRAYLDLLADVTGRLGQGGDAGHVAEVAVPASLERQPTHIARLAVAATFALGPVSELLATAFAETGQPVTVDEAPYHQVLGALLNPRGVFTQPDATAGLIFIRGVDLKRFRRTWTHEALAALADEYVAAFTNLGARGRMPVIVGFLPSESPDAMFDAWDRELAARLRKVAGLVVLPAEQWTRYYPVDERFAPDTDAIAHVPFTHAFSAAIALTAARNVWSLRRPPLKVVAVDGDNTLWGGIAEEIGPDAVDLTGARSKFAEKLLELRSAGVLLVLVSKNTETTLRAVLGRTDSILRAEHFALISAGWDSKSSRLEQCARSLNLGLSSFVFLDDNPVEIGEVRSRLPMVTAVTVPAVSELAEFLDHLWALDVHATTNEDRRRAELYQTEAQRTALRDRVEDFGAFIDQLKLEVDIRPLDAESLERSIQLGRRTNQFNLRPSVLQRATLDQLMAIPGHEIWTVSVRDRFGDYGQTGVLVLRKEGDVVEVVQWVLSCRVLGRGVEERVLWWLADRTVELECSATLLVAENTPRNEPARRLLAALGDGSIVKPRATVTPAHLRSFRFWEEMATRAKPAA
jgi:FkbH-like protein